MPVTASREREEALGRQVESAEHARHVQYDLADEPVVAVRDERAVYGEHVLYLTLGADENESDLRLVHAQVQQRVVQLSIRAQRPVRVSEFNNLFGVRRQLRSGAAHG